MGAREGGSPKVHARREFFAISLIRQLHIYANEKRVESPSIRGKGETDYVHDELKPLFAPELTPILDGDLGGAAVEDTVALYSNTSH